MIANAGIVATGVRVGVGSALWLGLTLVSPARADDAQPFESLDPDRPRPALDQTVAEIVRAPAEPPAGPGATDGWEARPHDADVEGDSAQKWSESPYAPHHTSGRNLRLGSAVGRLNHDDRQFTALGVTVAGGPRMGRFTLEGHYTFLDLTAPGPSSQHLGTAHRFAVMARADLIRLDSRIMGANSLLAIYGEAGLARQFHQWAKPGVYERPREVSLDGNRSGGVVGFGLNLDLRLEQPRGFPARVGWQLGWQLASSQEHAPDPTMICKGVSCLMQTTTGRTPTRDTSMLVTSTVGFTW